MHALFTLQASTSFWFQIRGSYESFRVHPGSVIGCIRGVIIYMSSFHGVAFRANLFQDFLEAIGHLLPNPEVDPLMVASSLCEIPEEFLFPGTLLHGNLVSWLASTDRMQDWVQSSLGNGLKNFFMAEEQTEDSVAVFSDLKVRVAEI